ncbi:uncharacterized protein LOC132603925 [Lycium barbarum]|uniref:uncharacterized protein LOC132603925 n=1 Tax=Lycium barbarum TaxID=112863 RepID=UPI00293EB6C7|nr:uncharacterized protein LOC132603925 [Lycium barbarum]
MIVRTSAKAAVDEALEAVAGAVVRGRGQVRGHGHSRGQGAAPAKGGASAAGQACARSVSLAPPAVPDEGAEFAAAPVQPDIIATPVLSDVMVRVLNLLNGLTEIPFRSRLLDLASSLRLLPDQIRGW